MKINFVLSLSYTEHNSYLLVNEAKIYQFIFQKIFHLQI